MRIVASFALLLLFSAAAQPAFPKLAVILVVDQMRPDYVTRFQRDWTGGLKRLVSGGAVFENAAYPYLTTVTCAGHATIATGDFPHTHGMIANSWWDRERDAQVTCTEDPRTTGIGYEFPFGGGDSGWRLQRPTFADVMRSQRHALVASLALKDRSAIMLAGHGGDAVTWFSESLEGWVTTSAFAEGPVAVVRNFIAQNPVRGDFGKVWNRMLPGARDAPADDQAGEAPPAGWSNTFPHVLNGVGNSVDAGFIGQWERSPYADAYVARLAAALVDGLALGTHEGTDVLGVSFSSPDMVGHAFGPRSLEEQDLYAHLDRTLGAFLDHLDAKVGRGRWVAALSSDHGVTPIAEQLVAEGRDAGRVTTAMVTGVVEQRLRASLGDGRYAAQLIGNDLWLPAGVMDRLRAQPRALNNLFQGLREVPGVLRVFNGDDLRDAAGARDPLQRAAALSYFPGRSGDIVIAMKPGWALGASGAQHGGYSPDDQRVPLIFYGAGIRPGRYKEAATPADVAPTLAAVTGASLPNVEGRALTAALAK
jgi:predicted AlkP superfamily pyrophosphatase or phosphodiesterase